MRYTTLLGLVLMFPASAIAQDVPVGCYTRDYSDAHLASNPDQVVDRISIEFIRHDEFTSAEVKVLLADQGHSGRAGYGGQFVSEVAANYATPLQFGIECDGGSFDVIESDSQGIVIETGWFRLSDNANGCSGEDIRSNLHEEVGSSTRYRLTQSAAAACKWE